MLSISSYKRDGYQLGQKKPHTINFSKMNLTSSSNNDSLWVYTAGILLCNTTIVRVLCSVSHTLSFLLHLFSPLFLILPFATGNSDWHIRQPIKWIWHMTYNMFKLIKGPYRWRLHPKWLHDKKKSLNVLGPILTNVLIQIQMKPLKPLRPT